MTYIFGISFYTCRFEQLEEYKKKNDHVEVPARYNDIPGLGRFCNLLRNEYQKFRRGEKTAMTEERVKKLARVYWI